MLGFIFTCFILLYLWCLFVEKENKRELEVPVENRLEETKDLKKEDLEGNNSNANCQQHNENNESSAQISAPVPIRRFTPSRTHFLINYQSTPYIRNLNVRRRVRPRTLTFSSGPRNIQNEIGTDNQNADSVQTLTSENSHSSSDEQKQTLKENFKWKCKQKIVNLFQ